MHHLNHEIIRLRAEETNRRAQRLGPLLAGVRGAAAPHAQSPVTVRLACTDDGPVLVRVADLDCAPMPTAPLLVGERAGVVVAALSLRDGALVADPFVPTADIVALLRLRARQIRAHERSPLSLRLPLSLPRLRRADGR